MIERLRSLAVPLLAAVVALFVGLGQAALETGRLIPFDWLVPGFLALVLMILAESRGGRRPDWMRLMLYVLLVLLPPLLLVVLAGTTLAVEALLTFAMLLGLAALLLRWCFRRGPALKWGVPLLCLMLFAGLQFMNQRLHGMVTIATVPHVGVMSALPLFRSHGATGGLLDVGGRSPIMAAVQVGIEPIDRLDPDSIEAFDHLLLAQPRLLRPEELVALDGWVRKGGQLVILADPLLQWPDRRPLGDPQRAPLTSLLDPLLTHWGLVLEPARLDGARATERRVLSRGAVIELAAASRFTLAKNAPCALEEDGLIARCRIGGGTATLVADADWIDDRLWTLDPAHPIDDRFWTSDAASLLRHLVQGRAGTIVPSWPWIKSQDALISGLRWAIGLIFLLGVLLAVKGPIPISAHDPPGRNQGQEGDSDSVSPDSVT